jgi:hypothetical protein
LEFDIFVRGFKNMNKILISFAFLFIALTSFAQQSGPSAQHPNVQKLINADKIYGMPTSGSLPDELSALQFVFTMADAPFELVKVYRYGSPAGKVYALMGLKALGSQHFEVFKKDFIRRGQGSVQFILPGAQPVNREAVQLMQQWETDYDQGAPYTRVKP